MEFITMNGITKIALVSLVFLSGCANKPTLPPLPENDKATIKLAESADSVSHSMLELARIQQTSTPPVIKLPEPSSYGIRQTASIDWAGPIQPLVEKLGLAIGYRVVVIGQPPGIPVLVYLNTNGAPVANILRDVDFQGGDKAHVVVYPNSRTIELRYAKP